MSINATSHASRGASPLSMLLGAQNKPAAKKADNDADDAPVKTAAPKSSANGLGQRLDKRV